MLYWAGKRFYHVRPAYEVHRSWPLDFEWGRISWNAVNGYLADVAPLLGLGGWVALAAIGALGAWYAMRRQWKPALAALCALVMLVLVFGVNKVHDGLPTVFYSWSRMFLAYPLLLGVLLARFAWAPRRYWAVLLPVGALAFIALKWRELPDAVARETAVGANTNVHVASIGELRGHCGALRAVASEQRAGLVVLGWHPLKHLTAYACPCLEPGYPETVEPALDRRAWKLVELAPRVEPTVLFACFLPEDFAWRMRENSAIRVASEAPLTFVLGGNADRTDTLLARLRMPLRPH